MLSETINKPRLLLVDDQPSNLKLLKQILENEYRLFYAKTGNEALELAKHPQPPGLILMDVMMPELNGFDTCRALKSDPRTRNIPVIFITAMKEAIDEVKGFEAGGVDYITKPFSPAIVKARIKTHLSLVEADEVKKNQVLLIQCLGRAAEYKENETGKHIVRMSHYARIIAEAYGFSDELSEQVFLTSPMHDLGKIGIPEEILLKPGKLTEAEYEVMKQHPQIGAEILGDNHSSFMKMAYNIALYHHEKWDGTGYPYGLKGSDIPLEARIAAIADVFDALTSVRPYKTPWTIERTLKFFDEQSGIHFDPDLVILLHKELDKVLEVYKRWS